MKRIFELQGLRARTSGLLNSRGIGITEVIVSVAIISIVVIALGGMIAQGRGSIEQKGRNRIALALAEQKLEGLRRDVKTGGGASGNDVVSLDGVNGTRDWTVGAWAVDPTLKELYVKVSWTESGMANPEAVELKTLVSP